MGRVTQIGIEVGVLTYRRLLIAHDEGQA